MKFQFGISKLPHIIPVRCLKAVPCGEHFGAVYAHFRSCRGIGARHRRRHREQTILVAPPNPPALRGQSFSQRPPPPGAAARRRLPIVDRAAQRPHALQPLPPARSRHGPPIIVPPGLPSPTSCARSGRRCRCEPVHHTRPRTHIAPSHRHACRHPAPRVHRRRRLRRRPTRRRPVLLCQPRLRENEDAALRRQRLVFILLPPRRGLLSLGASPRLRRSQARIRPREAPLLLYGLDAMAVELPSPVTASNII